MQWPVCERCSGLNDLTLDREAAIEAGGELLGRRSKIELALGAPTTVLSFAS